MVQEQTGKKSETGLKTFRLPASLVAALEAEAEDRGISLNSLASLIFLRHVNWEVKSEKFGLMPVYKPVLKGLIEGLDDESIDEIGRKILPSMWKDMAEFWFGGTSLASILEVFKLTTRHVSNFQSDVKSDASGYAIVLHHDLGPKMSMLYRSGLDELLRSEFHVQPSFTLGETTLQVHFPAPK